MRESEGAKDLYWVDTANRYIRHLHGRSLTTLHAITYNAYMVVGERVNQIDVTYDPFFDEVFSGTSCVNDSARSNFARKVN